MLRTFAKPIPLALILGFATAIPVLMAIVRVVQVPLGQMPEDSLRLMAAPVSMWLHALGGGGFGILGIVQFSRVVARRFGRLHRLCGRLFVLFGAMMGLGGLAMWLAVPNNASPVLDVARVLAGLALLVALARGVQAARARDFDRHGAWMIRAYAIGMGAGTVALVYFPIYIVTGRPVDGLTADLIFVIWWALNVVMAEWIVRRPGLPRPRTIAAE